MPTYVFSCECGTVFENFSISLPDVPVKWAKCGCGKKAPRDMGKENVNFTGSLKTGTGKGSIYHETKKAFGVREEGGRAVAAFENTKELDGFMAGRNMLGPPVVTGTDEHGNPVFLKRQDGSVVHDGAKLVKYGPSDGPSREDNPEPSINLAALDDRMKRLTGEGLWDEEPGDGWKSSTGHDAKEIVK